jgi:hypothetical protein
MDDTDVLQGILNRLDGDWRQRANTVWGLAEVIINYCAKNVLDSENMQGEEYQFMDFFSYSISNVVGAPSIGVSPKVQLSSSLQFYLQMNDQADKYAEFLKASERMKDLNNEEQELQKTYRELELPVPREVKKRLQAEQGQELDALFDITQEGELLKETRDILDELQMILRINEDQHNVLRAVRDILGPKFLDQAGNRWPPPTPPPESEDNVNQATNLGMLTLVRRRQL